MNDMDAVCADMRASAYMQFRNTYVVCRHVPILSSSNQLGDSILQQTYSDFMSLPTKSNDEACVLDPIDKHE